MAEFLEVIENIQAEKASVQKLFGGEGTGMRGFSRHREADARYQRKLAEAAKLIGNVVAGRAPLYYLKEALGTSDFPILFADVLDRLMLAQYQGAPSSWSMYIRRRTVTDFREVKRRFVEGANGVLQPVKPQGEYQDVGLSEGEYGYRVGKFGATLALAWEAIINDDLDTFKDIPEFFGLGAARTEELFATNLIADENGPHAAFYNAGNGNLLTGNPLLSVASLQDAMTVLMTQKDAKGGPIVVQGMVLVVPPHMEPTAQNIVRATQIEFTENGGTSGQKLITPNWMNTRIKVAANYFLPFVATTGTVGQTCWFLFADPNATVGRPAAEMGFLAGHETPEIFMKLSNQVRVGSSTPNMMDGDFETDATAYKVRHVLGGTRMDPKATVGSKGTGVA